LHSKITRIVAHRALNTGGIHTSIIITARGTNACLCVPSHIVSTTHNSHPTISTTSGHWDNTDNHTLTSLRPCADSNFTTHWHHWALAITAVAILLTTTIAPNINFLLTTVTTTSTSTKYPSTNSKRWLRLKEH
jgi:hypothetical protein